MHLACLIHMHLTSPQLRDQSLLSQQKWNVWIITKIKWSQTEPSYSWTDLTLCLTCGQLLPWTWDLMTQGHSVRLDAMLCLQSLPLFPYPLHHQEPSPTSEPHVEKGSFFCFFTLPFSWWVLSLLRLPVSMLCQLGPIFCLSSQLWNFMLTSTPSGLQSSLLDPG